MVLVEAHDKLGHQGVNKTCHLIKWQYSWKDMNKDISKCTDNCALCTYVYLLQMTDRPFDKIAIDLVSDLIVPVPGNQHILTITDQLTGWPEAFSIPDKKTDTIVCVFINNYLPIHLCPHFILSGQWNRIQEPFNWTTFSNNLA